MFATPWDHDGEQVLNKYKATGYLRLGGSADSTPVAKVREKVKNENPVFMVCSK